MPTGWFVIEPPTSGVMPPALRRAKANFVGQQPTMGPLTPKLPKVLASLNGRVDPAGGISSKIARTKCSMAGTQTQYGTMGAKLRKPTANFAIENQGQMSASIKRTLSSLNGKETFTGALGSALRRAKATLAGSQNQSGSMISQVKKATASFTGNTPISVSYSAPFASVPTGMVTVRSAGSGNIGLNGSNLREGTAGASAFTYHIGILADVLGSSKFFTEVGAAGTNGTDRGIGAGASNDDGSLMVFCYAIGNGGAAAIYTKIGSTWTSRATDTSVQITALNDKIRLVPSVSAGVVTWTVYKNGVATSLTWTDSGHLADLPGTRPCIAFRHYDSFVTNYYSQGINSILATEI